MQLGWTKTQVVSQVVTSKYIQVASSCHVQQTFWVQDTTTNNCPGLGAIRFHVQKIALCVQMSMFHLATHLGVCRWWGSDLGHGLNWTANGWRGSSCPRWIVEWDSLRGLPVGTPHNALMLFRIIWIFRIYILSVLYRRCVDPPSFDMIPPHVFEY